MSINLRLDSVSLQLTRNTIYCVYKSTGGPTFTFADTVHANTESLGSVSWDDTDVSSGNSYTYKVKSITSDNDTLDFSWPYTVEFEPDSLKSVFWPSYTRVDTVQYWGSSRKQVRSRFVIEAYRPDVPQSVWLEVDTLHARYFKGFDPDSVIVLDFDNNIADTTVFTIENLEGNDQWYGGYPFRIGYTYDGLDSLYYPQIGTEYTEHDHSFTTNINNRVHSAKFESYMTDKENETARSLFIDVMVQKDEPEGDEVGVLPRGFNNIFIDSATPRLLTRQVDVWPAGAISDKDNFQQSYSDAIINTISELRTDVNDPNVMIIHNGTGLHQYISYLAQADGAMMEHFGGSSSQVHKGCAWLNMIHAVLYAQEQQVSNPKSYFLYPTVSISSANARIYSLASFFLVKDDSTLLDMQYQMGQLLYPETLLSMGARLTALSASDFYSGNCDPPVDHEWWDLEDVPPDKAGDPPSVCQYEKGWSVINWKTPAVDFPSSEIPDSVKYKVCLDALTLKDGGRIWTELVDRQASIPGGSALVLLADSIYSPVVEDTALYPLYADDQEWSRLAVRASHWNGEPLTYLNVDMNPAGIQDTLQLRDDGSGLDDEADDGVYTYPDTLEISSSLAYGTYALPAHAKGSDGLEIYDSVIANVVPIPVAKYERQPKETTQLDYYGMPYSSVTLDYDKDGRMDLLLSKKNATGQIFRWLSETANEEIPVFDDQSDVAFQLGEKPAIGTRGIAVADYNNDKWPDIFAAHDSIPRLYKNEGGTFDDELDERINPSDLAKQSFMGIWGDYNRDTKVDLFIVGSSYTGQDPSPEALYGKYAQGMLLKNEIGDSTGQFMRADTLAFDGSPGVSGVTALWGYADDDSLLDLFVGNLTVGESRLYINDGPDAGQGNEYTFTDATSTWFGTGPNVVSAACWIDYDRDGKQDLAVARMTASDGNHVQLYRNTGTGFSKQKMKKKGFMLIGEDQIGIAALDFDLNGYQDLLVLPEENDQEIGIYANSLYQGGVRFAQVSRICDIREGAANGLALADYNLDGDSDLFLGRLSSTDSVYAQNVSSGTGGDPVFEWIGLRLHGGRDCNNSYGIGAKVKVTFGADEAIQVVDGGSGRGGQMPWPVLFGLGSYAGSTVSADIKWPNGWEQTETCAVGTYVDVYDSTGPGIDQGSVLGRYQTGPTQTDWYFDWDTARYCYAEKDTVKIISSSGGPDCGCGEPVALTESRSDVDLEITENPGGGYHHKLTWYDRCCVPRCKYDFSVHSGTEYGTGQAGNYILGTKTCLGP